MKPCVSVVIPTRNRAELLREALDSVFRQDGIGTQFDMDVIVVDDVSTDATPDVVAGYSKVRYLRLPVNHGSAGARNAGIKLSTGCYVAFIDDDDLWLPNKLALQVPALEAHPEMGMAYSQFIISSEGRKYVHPDSAAPSGSIFQRLLFINLCGIPAVLIRREALDKVGGFNTALRAAEDYDLWLRLAFQFPVLFVLGIVAIYRRSSASRSITTLLNGTYAKDVRLIVETALAKLPDTEESCNIKRQARATLELGVGEDLVGQQQAPLAWQHLRAALEMWPGIALSPQNRLSVALIAGRYAATSASPIAATNRLWAEIGPLLGGLGKRESIGLSGMLAAIQWEAGIALGKGIGCPVNVGNAVHAVARSIVHSPRDLSKWGALLRFSSRSITHVVHKRLFAARKEKR